MSLMEAADRVDSTAGRADGLPQAVGAARASAARAARARRCSTARARPRASTRSRRRARFAADVAYLDPPYNQHSYLGNYHVWESLVRWDKPEVYGVAMKRVDVRERASAVQPPRRDRSRRSRDGARTRAGAPPGGLVQRRGLPDRSSALRAMLAERGAVRVVEVATPALHRRPDRDLQPAGREGRHPRPGEEPRAPVRRRVRRGRSTACAGRAVSRRQAVRVAPLRTARR